MEMQKITIRLGVTKPTSRQYESVRADVTCEYELSGATKQSFAKGAYEAFGVIKGRTKELLKQSIATAEETLQPAHKTESGKLEFRNHD